MEQLNKLYKNNELIFSLIIIFLYILINSAFDVVLIKVLFTGLLLSLLLIFIKNNNLFSYYKLHKPKLSKTYLLFFYIFSLFNLGCGFDFKSFNIFELILMIEVGIIEEIIFRAFLFKAIENYSMNKALIITSITFGLGHIANLLNGMSIIDNLIQVIFALLLGFLYGLVLIQGNSLYPCIISHVIIDSTTVISMDKNNFYYFTCLIIIVLVLIHKVRRNHE